MNQYFDARRANAVRLLAEKGIPSWKRVPAFYRFVWSCGIKLRPPHFASWEANFFLFGGTVGAAGAIGAWLAITAAGKDTAIIQATVIGIGGLIVNGFSQAARHKREAEEHRLPAWDDLPDVAGVFD